MLFLYMNILKTQLTKLLDELNRCGRYIYMIGGHEPIRQFKIHTHYWSKVDGNNGILKQIINTQEQIRKLEQNNLL